MTQIIDASVEREFLHDLSNILAIAQGTLQMVVRKIQKNPDDIKLDDIQPQNCI